MNIRLADIRPLAISRELVCAGSSEHLLILVPVNAWID